MNFQENSSKRSKIETIYLNDADEVEVDGDSEFRSIVDDNNNTTTNNNITQQNSYRAAGDKGSTEFAHEIVNEKEATFVAADKTVMSRFKINVTKLSDVTDVLHDTTTETLGRHCVEVFFFINYYHIKCW
jgi:hypothetical protein